MSKNVGSAHGGVSLAVSPWTLRGVIPALGRTPALRGYPGGIDAAGPGWSGLTVSGNHLEPSSASPPGSVPVTAGGLPAHARSASGTAAGKGKRQRPWSGRAASGRAASGRAARAPEEGATAGPAGPSVWQQSSRAWHDAGLEWQRPAGWETADADLQRTEPIPVVPAVAAPAGAEQEAGRGRQLAHRTRQETARGARKPGAGEREAGRDGGKRSGAAGRAGQAGQHPGHLAGGGEHPGHGRLHPRGSGRTLLVGAIVCVALLAVAVAGIIITGPRSGGHDRGLPGLALAYPPAGQFAGLGGSPAQRVPPTLTGVAAAGATVVAVGSQAALPYPRPLVLISPDGGHSWRSAVLRAPGGGPAAGAVPLMVAGAPGRWLAVAPDGVWTSPDGRYWRLGPAIAPLAGGDRVAALAPTGSGFVAAGENVRSAGTGTVRAPVLWISANGLTWQRRDAAQLALPAGRGRAVALRWVAAHGSTLMVAGEVARTVVTHRGKRKVSVVRDSWAVWRSTDNGAHWLRADPPVSHGATAQLAGLAPTATGIVAIRPGHRTGRVRDAVAFVWARGHAWRFAARLTARKGASLHVAAVAGDDQGVVVTGSAGRRRVAFTSVHGWSWRRTADLGRSSAMAVTSATAGPGAEVVAAGAARPGPLLLLAGAHRLPVGQAALAAAVTTGLGVNGLAAGPAGQVAVGHADGAPAIWVRPAGGRWEQVPVAAPPSWHGTGPGLTSVVHGDAGWLAVGGESARAAAAVQLGAAGTLASAVTLSGQQPVLVTSPDGKAWQPSAGAGSLTGPGVILAGAAAGPAGYVVAGVRDDDGQPAAALWWSADLTTWVPQGSWTGSAPGGAASALLTVAAGRTGFAAVGAVGTHPAVWVSTGGQRWRSRLLAVPAGASSAVLQRVAIKGNRIAALGMQARPSGPVPFAAVSANGGRTWREAALPVPGTSASVTALITAGGGFLATGALGAGGTQDVVVWWSADGLAWHAVRPAGRWLRGPGAQQITGLSATGNLLTGVGYTATGPERHPVLWQARIR
ncbi:MAG TPA: hypothetical protein VLW44_12305 [Streptosporangiaceae bacterium]|nr:hypothetical protein [Streptosporangiaceae bacterium]